MTRAPQNIRTLCGVDIKMHAFSKTIHISGHCGPFKPKYVMSIELGTPTTESTDSSDSEDNHSPTSPVESTN